MTYTVDWREDAAGGVVITPGGVGAVRLVGLLFGAPGAWLLYQFIGGVLHPDEMTIFGWVLLPAMAAVFLIPAWIILVGRKRTRIHATTREATEEMDVLVYTRRKVTAIPRDAHVMLRYEKSGNRYPAHVYIDPTGKASAGLVLLAMFAANDTSAALEFAQKVARLLAVDVRDRRVERGDVNAAGAVVGELGSDEAD